LTVNAALASLNRAEPNGPIILAASATEGDDDDEDDEAVER